MHFEKAVLALLSKHKIQIQQWHCSIMSNCTALPGWLQNSNGLEFLCQQRPNMIRWIILLCVRCWFKVEDSGMCCVWLRVEYIIYVRIAWLWNPCIHGVVIQQCWSWEKFLRTQRTYLVLLIHSTEYSGLKCIIVWNDDFEVSSSQVRSMKIYICAVWFSNQFPRILKNTSDPSKFVLHTTLQWQELFKNW